MYAQGKRDWIKGGERDNKVTPKTTYIIRGPEIEVKHVNTPTTATDLRPNG